MGEEGIFKTEVLRQFHNRHREINQVKNLSLKIIESHSLGEAQKMSYKKDLAALAASLHQHFNSLRFKRINKFNIDEVEHYEVRFLSALDKQISLLIRKGKKLSPIKVDLSTTSISEEELDAGLLQSKIGDQQALGKDKLDQLNSIRSFLSEKIEQKISLKDTDAGKEAIVKKDLLSLKIRNYTEGLTGYETRNPDILYKVKIKIENVLSEKVRTHVLPGCTDEHSRALNHRELYLCDDKNGNYRISYVAGNICFQVKLLLMRITDKRASEYFGEISGWAEAGINNASFGVKDKQPPAVSSAPEHTVKFLKKIGFYDIYQHIMMICETKSKEQEAYESRLEQEMKERVSQALDTLL